MKKLVRLLIKIPATSFVVAFCISGFMIFSVFMFFQWAYESDNFDKKVVRECRDDMIDNLKKWFTTI